MSAFVVQQATKERWQQIVDDCPWATFFHTPAWSEILVTAFPRWRSEALVTDYNGISILFPYLSYPLLGTSRYVESLLPGVYGGLVATASLDNGKLPEIWKSFLPQSNFIVFGNPYMRQGFELGCLGPKVEIRRDFTLSLELNRDYEDLFRTFRKSYRQNIRRVPLDGVAIHLTTSLEDIAEYFRVYRDALGRWGKRATGFYPLQLFQAMAIHPEMGQKVRLWVARAGSEVVGGIWVFHHNKHAVYWHGATLTKYLSGYISHALVAAAIRDACDNGMRWFDFNPSGGHPGVELFKRGFGAHELGFTIARKLNLLGKSYRFGRHLKQRVFKRTPL